VEAVLNTMEKLVSDILAAFPPGKLPPAEEFSHKGGPEYEAVLKYPEEPGWKNLYTLGFPTL
jgi:creatinine amidohydrolase